MRSLGRAVLGWASSVSGLLTDECKRCPTERAIRVGLEWSEMYGRRSLHVAVPPVKLS